MKQPIALLNDVLPSGTPVFGPFDESEDASAPQLPLPSYHFSQAGRGFVAYSAAPLSEADRDALRGKVARLLESEQRPEQFPVDGAGEQRGQFKRPQRR